MPITPIPVVPKLFAVQYDGTNGQDIVDYLGKTLTSDTGTELVFVIDPTRSAEVPVDWWVVFSTSFYGDPIVAHYDQVNVTSSDDLAANFQELT